MKIIENFLSEEDFKQLKRVIQKVEFPWSRAPILPLSLLDTDPMYNVQFVHRFVECFIALENGVVVEKTMKKSDYYHIVHPIVERINPSEIIKLKSNLTVNRGISEKAGFHTDVSGEPYYGNGMTGIYYVNTCNGGTFFESGEMVNSVENRFVYFPNTTRHSPVSATDVPYRMVVNFNWVP